MIDIIKESVVDDWGWALVALAGNLVFALRFFIQWICSERRGKSYLPISFWLLLAVYAVHIRNFMVLLTVCLTVPIYIRNFMLMRKNVGK